MNRISNPRSPSRLESAIATCLMLPVLAASAQTLLPDQPYTVTDRGAFYRVWQRTVPVTDSLTGQVTSQLQSYTELEDGMHYLNDGAWSESQDLVEVTSNGAQAVHGQMKASFSSDITSIGAITLTTGSEVFKSHPLGLFYFDSALGKVARIASIQSGDAVLYPPNVLVFSNVLSNVKADLMLVWAKNGYEQNLVLKQRPPSPESFGFSSSDGGQTFSPNIPLESGQSDARYPQVITDDWGNNYMDYTGLAYYGGYFYPAWADNSNSDANRDNPDLTGEMDIYVARVKY